MKSISRFARCLLAAVFFMGLAILAAPGFAEAHGTDYRILDPDTAIVVEFIYDDNQPMRFAEVLVFSPADDEIEHQNGRTDMNGRFVFYPDIPGKWRIQADDGAGHLERASIEIAEADEGTGELSAAGDRSEASGHTHGNLSRLWAVVLGLSLIANIFMGFYLVRRNNR